MRRQKKQKLTVEDVKNMVALFEGRQIDDKEAKKLIRQSTTRRRILKETFRLSDDEVTTVINNAAVISDILHEFCFNAEEKIKEHIRDIERRALEKMSEPGRADRVRRLRALMASR